MKLEDIGFYTLSDYRAHQVSQKSPLWRCELILTDKCNFKCPYCRGLDKSIAGTMSLENAKEIVDIWANEGIKNVRFSGGEPTVYPWINNLVEYTASKGLDHIAISTNGSAPTEKYLELIKLGVNDFSISLDACCSSYGEKMSGGIKGAWERVIENIKVLSKLTYVTVGVVITEETVSSLVDIVNFADSLGVSDIRIISAAQYNSLLGVAMQIDNQIINKYPILKYRINNIKKNRNVRGITELDSRRCSLVLDDMAVANNKHFPCIIYMREGGQPIGDIRGNIRQDRYDWFMNHDSHKDPICKKNCLDVCIDHNNKYCKCHIAKSSLPEIDSSLFGWSEWRSGSINDLFIPSRFDSITSVKGKETLRQYAIGWCPAEKLPCRTKIDHVALMCQKDEQQFWFHLRNNEFYEVFV
ncbi:MAG: radical SAM protein [Bacteroidota bacterium]|nr:radical SAM protein [Bacteroidota bacterium]